MGKLSVFEFKKFCETLKPSCFIFSFENQNWNKVENTFKLKSYFENMSIALDLSEICFKNNNCYLCLNRVKYVNREEISSPLGEIFTIICGDSSQNKNEKRYTFIVR